MTDKEIISTNEVDDLLPMVSIDAKDAQVSIQLKAGIEPWQALGLIEAALVLIKAQYSNSATLSKG